jgi:hypothetical protein
MSRKRFRTNIAGTSDPALVPQTRLNVTIQHQRKYYVQCFGELIEITPSEALQLDINLVIIL